MRCRVAALSQVAEAIVWETADGTRRKPQAAPPPKNEAVVAATPNEISQLRSQLVESESRRQGEVVKARQEGYAEGVRKAREETAAELRASFDRIAQTVADLAGTKKKIRADAEGELLTLSLAIAKRILHRELVTDPEALQGLVHTAMQKLQNREISKVRVYAAGADAVRNALERIGAAPAVQVFPDSTLKSGDLIFETSFGDLDASVDTQLAEIQRGFADRLSSR